MATAERGGIKTAGKTIRKHPKPTGTEPEAPVVVDEPKMPVPATVDVVPAPVEKAPERKGAVRGFGPWQQEIVHCHEIAHRMNSLESKGSEVGYVLPRDAGTAIVVYRTVSQ
ncbi:MAG TPA: hypothetical protein VEB22_05925 [Phycisphaerales bacterium]|nr:hypothetical protein [Phycisphaerales bacterium]